MSELDWTIGNPRMLEVTIEVTITKSHRIRVMNQEEAGKHCDRLSDDARTKNPGAYIGCGVTRVELAK